MDRVDDFYNELLLAFAMPDRMVYKKLAKGKYTARNLAVVRNNIMKADRFFVSNELIQEAVKMSYMPPQKLFDLIGFARPCMNNMWIEWEEVVRVDANHKYLTSLNLDKPIEPINYDTIAVKCGYHICRLAEFYDMMSTDGYYQQKLNNTRHAENTYVYFMYAKASDGKISVRHMLGILAWKKLTPTNC